MNTTGSQQTGYLVTVICAAILLPGILLVIITGSGEEPLLTIAVKQGVESVALKEIAQSFSHDKHVGVEVIELPYDELFWEEQRQLARRPQRLRDSTPPFDVIMLDDPWLYALVSDPEDASARRLAKLNGVFGADKDDFFPSTLKVSSYCPEHDECGDYYAIPVVANSQLFAYNAADLNKKPTTWEEVAQAAARTEKGDHIGYVTRIGPGNSIVTDFMPILWAYDPDSFPEFVSGNSPLIHSETPVETLKKLVATRKNLGSASFDDFDVSAYLQKDRASMGIVWSAWAMMLVDIDEQMRQRHLAEFGVDSPKTEKLVFGTIPRESKYEAHSELGAWLLAIPENSEQSDLALEFIEYAADLGKYSNSGHVRSLTAARSGTPPPRQSVLAELENQTKFSEWHPSLFAAIRSSLDEKFSRARPRTACWKEIESRLGSYLEKSIDQEIAAKDIPSEANQNLRVLFDDKKCREFLQSQSAHGPAVYAASQSKVLRREVANILPH